MKTRLAILVFNMLFASGCALNNQCTKPEESSVSENVLDLDIIDKGSAHLSEKCCFKVSHYDASPRIKVES